jgi:hypothetical protein
MGRQNQGAGATANTVAGVGCGQLPEILGEEIERVRNASNAM